MHRISLVLLALSAAQWATVAGAAGAANPNPWEQVLDDGDARVFSRAVPGSEIRELKAETVFDAPVEKVWAVIDDVERYPEFLPHSVSVRILERFPGGAYVHIVTDPPVINRRDYTVKVKVMIDPQTRVYQRFIELANDHAPPLESGVVRVPTLGGYWSFEPVDGDRTRAEYVMHFDPGGMVPSFIANTAAKRGIPELFDSIRKRVQDPTWRLE